MNTRKFFLIALVIGLLVLGVSAVSAQAVPLAEGRVERLAREVVAAVAETLGLTSVQLTDRLLDGDTLVEIIAAEGSSVEAVSAEVVALLTERIHAGVENGDLTQRRADRLLERLSSAVERVIADGLPHRALERAAQISIIRLAADQTGLEPAEIRAQLRDGQTLAAILAANDVSVDTFINDAVSRLATRLDKLVGRGRITQERADEMAQQFRDRLAERINQVGVEA